MKHGQAFNEVMIVNPSDPRFGANQGVRLMQNYYYPYGYYAEPPAGYGYFAEAPGYAYDGRGEPYGYYGYYGQPPQEMFGWGDPYGYAPVEPGYEQPMGYFAAEDPYGYEGYYADDYPPLEQYYEPEPMGYYAADEPYEPVGWYGEEPEMYGYGAEEPMEGYAGMGYYAAPGMGRYERAMEPKFNARCACPTNVQGFGEEEFDGYVQPSTVNATCERFTPQPGSPAAEPETFKPLW